MVEFRFLPVNLEARARLKAAELQPHNKTVRHREIKIAAGRLAESMLANGAERWLAVQVEDSFAEMLRQRLTELDRQAGECTIVRNVTRIRREGAAA
ncbi:hypothetical protein [Rhizobium mayense]|uniref:hypothetical protein n=1 Tax=Rhizobium mayense TaxID=1312184 RepID=UPI00398C4A02